jgi:hypothetical protein
VAIRATFLACVGIWARGREESRKNPLLGGEITRLDAGARLLVEITHVDVGIRLLVERNHFGIIRAGCVLAILAGGLEKIGDVIR